MRREIIEKPVVPRVTLVSDSFIFLNCLKQRVLLGITKSLVYCHYRGFGTAFETVSPIRSIKCCENVIRSFVSTSENIWILFDKIPQAREHSVGGIIIFCPT